MNINLLPDDCLGAIFALERKHFTPLQLFRLREVCVRWNAIIEQVFRSVYSLRLFNSRESLSKFESLRKRTCAHLDDEEGENGAKVEITLIVRKFKGQSDESRCILSRAIALLFANLRSLVLHSISGDALDVSHLLLHCVHLQSVSLTDLGKSPSETLSHIAKLPNLRRLYLCGVPFPPLVIAQLEPVLRNLSHFSLLDCLALNVSVQLVRSLSRRVRCLRLEWIDCADWAAMSAALLHINSLTHLTLGYFAQCELDSVKLLPFVCRNFAQLQYFDFQQSVETPLVQVLPELAQLSHLSDLRLVVRNNALDNFARASVKPLDSLRSLTLTRLCVCHYVLTNPSLTYQGKRLRLLDAFPNVCHITVRSHCLKCLPIFGQFCFQEQLPKLVDCEVHSLP